MTRSIGDTYRRGGHSRVFQVVGTAAAVTHSGRNPG